MMRIYFTILKFLCLSAATERVTTFLSNDNNSFNYYLYTNRTVLTLHHISFLQSKQLSLQTIFTYEHMLATARCLTYFIYAIAGANCETSSTPAGCLRSVLTVKLLTSSIWSINVVTYKNMQK